MIKCTNIILQVIIILLMIILHAEKYEINPFQLDHQLYIFINLITFVTDLKVNCKIINHISFSVNDVIYNR